MSKRTKVTPITRAPHGTATESFKRPDHPDFMDASELKKIRFSGVRQNNIGLRWEFWILGNMEKEVTFDAVKKDKFALTKAHVELFHMVPEDSLFERK